MEGVCFGAARSWKVGTYVLPSKVDKRKTYGQHTQDFITEPSRTGGKTPEQNVSSLDDG